LRRRWLYRHRDGLLRFIAPLVTPLDAVLAPFFTAFDRGSIDIEVGLGDASSHRRLRHLDGEIADSAVSIHLHRDLAWRQRLEHAYELTGTPHGVSAKGGNHVARTNASHERRRVGDDARDDNPVGPAVVDDDTEVVDRVVVLVDHYQFLDDQLWTYLDGDFSAVAQDDNGDHLMAEVRIKEVVDKVALAADALIVHRNDRVAAAETNVGQHGGARQVLDHQPAVDRAAKRDAEVASRNAFGAEVVNSRARDVAARADIRPNVAAVDIAAIDVDVTPIDVAPLNVNVSTINVATLNINVALINVATVNVDIPVVAGVATVANVSGVDVDIRSIADVGTIPNVYAITVIGSFAGISHIAGIPLVARVAYIAVILSIALIAHVAAITRVAEFRGIAIDVTARVATGFASGFAGRIACIAGGIPSRVSG
jgi:hypothetical protein